MSNKFKRNLPLHIMVLPAVIFSIVFVYVPLAGSIMAFQDYNPLLGFFNSPWVGLDNFRFVMNLPNTFIVLRNTIVIAMFKIIGMLIVPIIFTLLLNEIKSNKFRRTFQTFVYIPHFLSWVILSGIFINILSPSEGIVNRFIMFLGIEPIFFLGDPFWFPITMIVTDIWKGFGFGTVIYLASLTSINPELYEAAMVDGANRWRQTWHITLPGMAPIVILMSVLSLGGVLNAGFDQIFNMLNLTVMSTGDVLDTFIYRLGMEQRMFSVSTAVGLFRSFVSFIFISLSFFLADKFANYRIF